jgi:hypothetical protein
MEIFKVWAGVRGEKIMVSPLLQTNNNSEHILLNIFKVDLDQVSFTNNWFQSFNVAFVH